jgi:hypothetical protein
LFSTENQEKLYLYLIVSIGGGLVLLLLVVIARLLVQKRRARVQAKFNPNDSLPNEFAEEISEIDADISLATAIPAIPPPPPAPSQSEVVRYGGGGTGVRRHDSDTNPRSLSRPGNSQYYYG